MKMSETAFACDKCRVIHPIRFKAWTVNYEDREFDVCIICDREYDAEEARTHCNICKVECDDMKRVRDPDSKKMVNSCKKCYKEIKSKR